ncbi:hypothetical protein LZ198_14955 [Myxococcus sp. K15C18031901]|uniref:hypothetical protein n=1 Tax=Myxococcus dinghuensis TaxID=2906761 RepID=UPI0020A7DCA6|nr:hypothetical protein [Myxococcus dinghuensis]MCP3100172.1 hypothetical protein [Myxococcus dinghuensis]
MTRNVKRFLAVSLLSLAPSIAAAEQFDFGYFDLGYNGLVGPVKTETIEVPARHEEGGASFLANPVQVFGIGNWTGVNTFPIYSLSGITLDVPPPNPLLPVLNPGLSGIFQLTVAPATSVSQTYLYTNNTLDPAGNAKTCRWQVVVNYNATTATCSAVVNQTAFGTQGVLCGIDTTRTFINPTTCNLQVVTNLT